MRHRLSPHKCVRCWRKFSKIENGKYTYLTLCDYCKDNK